MERALRRPHVWDCGSTLYDSFELKSFERQLSLAINSRTLSMPHLDHKPTPSFSTRNPPPTIPKKTTNKISKSIHKLLKSMFKSKNERLQEVQGRHVAYDNSGALPTIPEAPVELENCGFSPKISSLMTRAASERLTDTSIGMISCA